MTPLQKLPSIGSINLPNRPVAASAKQVGQLDSLINLIQGQILPTAKEPIALGSASSAEALVKMLQMQSQIHAQVLRAELVSKALESANSAMRKLSQNAA